MTLSDRIGRSLFVALAVGLGWGIRGDFGHLVGAMYPGAALGLAFCYVAGGPTLFRRMPAAAALSAVAIGLGGTMSYGVLHGYAQSDTFINYAYGYLTLFLQGSAWGTFAGGLIGLLLERKPLRTGDWLGYAAAILLPGWLTSFVVVDLLGFQINPPRSNGSIAYFGAALGQLAWLASTGRRAGLRGALLGYLGFGLGMTVGRLLGNVANVVQAPLGITINHWNVMETSCGLIGGFVFAFGMLGRRYADPEEGEIPAWPSLSAIVFVVGLIPLWHRLNRITPNRRKEWAESLRSFGVADPAATSANLLVAIDALCAVGFVGVGVWGWAHFGRRTRWAALPVLWLSLTMLLFQNLSALFFHYPHVPGRVNMHVVFWVLFALMAVYVAWVRPGEAAITSPEADDARVPVAAWAAAAAAALGLVIFATGFVNGPVTMTSANTRWPVWSWPDGPFPGR